MDYDNLSSLFKALSHPTRLQILDMLRSGELCVCHIETALGKRQAYISQQLMFLREIGIVSSRKEGLQVYYQMADDRVQIVLDAILGEIDTLDVEKLEGCSCPQCSIISIQAIQ